MIQNNTLSSIPELWGGIECSFNRVENEFFDQLSFNGHYERIEDIDRFAQLGIKALHYPVLWEYHQPHQESIIQWDWTAERLERIRANNMTPIVSLLHHGSGPSFTNLLDDDFAVGLSNFARTVAERFPWITWYKPVNEPLTTARFSGLYGFWHPHLKSDEAFCRIFLNQLKAVVLSMKEIRKVNPSAKFIQTEDLAKTYSTPLIQYQADFENHRRWLTYDVLYGRLNHHHPLWEYFIQSGIEEETLYFFQDNPCPPDLLGANHYVTSERFLDDNIGAYPLSTHGGNGKHTYADVEAIRINLGFETGLKVLLKELQNRYSCDIALTEVHLHCTREEQLRWLKYAWEISLSLIQEGVSIKAVTVWALLGAYGWNKLLTKKDGDYESGVFDLRSPTPRSTALADMMKSFSEGKHFSHPLLNQKGWWEKPARFIYQSMPTIISQTLPASQPLLIIGKNGLLGRSFSKFCDQRGIRYHALDPEDMDFCDTQSIERVFKHFNPWAIVNAASYSTFDQAESAPHKCFDEYVNGIEDLIQFCKMGGVKLLTFSSNRVFDGLKNTAYIESDGVSPLTTYGRSKAKAEQLVLEADCNALIIRTSLLFNKEEPFCFIKSVMSGAYAQYYPHNVFISPTYVPDLVNMSLDLLIDNESGIWHLTNQGKTTWASFVSEIFQRSGHTVKLPDYQIYDFSHVKEESPRFSGLTSEKGTFLPPLSQALDQYFATY